MKEIKTQTDIVKYLTKAIAYYFTGANIRLVDELPTKGQFEVTYQSTKVDLIATYVAPSAGTPQHRVQIKHYQYKKLHQIVSMVNGNSLNSFKILSSMKAEKEEVFVPFSTLVPIKPTAKKETITETKSAARIGEWSKDENIMICEMFADQMTYINADKISLVTIEAGFGKNILERSPEDITARLELIKMTLKNNSGVLSREIYKDVATVIMLRDELQELDVEVWKGTFSQKARTLAELETRFGINRIGKKATISLENLEALIKELQ